MVKLEDSMEDAAMKIKTATIQMELDILIQNVMENYKLHSMECLLVSNIGSKMIIIYIVMRIDIYSMQLRNKDKFTIQIWSLQLAVIIVYY